MIIRKFIFKGLHEVGHWAENNKVLLLILTVAFLLRFIGTNPGYSQYHSDEGISYSQGIYMILERTLDAHGYALSYNYPTIVPLSNAIFDFFIFIPGSFLIYFFHHPRIFLFDIFHWSGAAKQLNLILWTEVFGERMFNVLHWGRYVTALYGFGVVILTYILAKKTFNKNVGLLAALLVTFNFRQVLNSHIGLPDMYNCFYLLCSIIFSLNLLKNPNTKNYILAGIFAGLSISTKFQIFSVIWLGLSYLYIFFKGKRLPDKIFNKKLWISLLFLVLTPIILNPYHIIHWQLTYQQLKDVSMKYSFGKNALSLYPYSYLYHIGIGQFLTAFSLIGSILFLIKDTKLALWFFVPMVYIFYTFTFYSNGGFYTRNFTSTTPIMLIFSAYFLYQLFLFLKSRFSYLISFGIVSVVLAVAIFIPARDSVINSYYYTQAWGYDTILQKSEPVLPDNFIIASHPFHTVSKIHPFKRIDFEFANSYSFAEFKEQGGQYAYVNMDLASNAFYDWMSRPLPESIQFWHKPVEMLNNTFFAASINEMMQYVVVSTYKPWQAPDAAIFITKIPDLESGINFRIIKQYNFNSDLEGWSVQGAEDSNQFIYNYDPSQGYSTNGSILNKPSSSRNGVVRISSPYFEIHPGHSYRITGYMKSDQDIPIDKRNSFLRADFLPNKTIGVSSRYKGNGWKKYSFDVLAPVNSNQMLISFQNAGSSSSNIWLDDIAIEESDREVKITGTYPVPLKVYQDLLYTNSHGNL